MKTFYFNTGVNPDVYPNAVFGGRKVIDGTVHLPVDVDDSVPDSAELLYCCSDISYLGSNVIAAEILNDAVLSKYAFFSVKD